MDFISYNVAFNFGIVCGNRGVNAMDDPGIFSSTGTCVGDGSRRVGLVSGVSNTSCSFALALESGLSSGTRVTGNVTRGAGRVTVTSVLCVGNRTITCDSLRGVRGLVRRTHYHCCVSNTRGSTRFISDVELGGIFLCTDHVSSNSFIGRVVSGLGIGAISGLSFRSPVTFSARAMDAGARCVNCSGMAAENIRKLTTGARVIRAMGNGRSSHRMLGGRILITPIARIMLGNATVGVTATARGTRTTSGNFVLPLGACICVSTC